MKVAKQQYLLQIEMLNNFKKLNGEVTQFTKLCRDVIITSKR